MRRSTPAAEVQIDAPLVRALLEDQHPDLADLPLTPVSAGWDNALYRLGASLAVRLPRRAVAAPLIVNEQRWLKELAPRLPVPVPVAQRIGAPGRGYPWMWSVTAWFDGRPASDEPLFAPDGVARALGNFLRALHVAAPEEAPSNSFRGLPLASRTERLHEHVRELEGLVDRDRVLSCWERLASSAPWTGPPVWVHGDLHPGNVILAEGRLAAVIDFGDLTAGDPATDLAAAWMLFPAASRQALREAAALPGRPIDDETWTRGKGWALALNLAWLVHSADDPKVERETLTAIQAVLEDC